MSNVVHRYHDGTKHHFRQFARSLGYLDWASQPHPFRSFAGAPALPLFPSPLSSTGGYAPRHVRYRDLFSTEVASEPVSAAAIGDLLRHALGLSAWKRFGRSAWSLRVNPSSGNLHPTEAYLVCGPSSGLAESAAVFHYAADRHELERRCVFADDAWRECVASGGAADVFLIALTSIHWREAWKYGERAFRYCQHDLGHAIGAIAVSAAMFGWRTRILAGWAQRTIAAICGIDRDDDYVEVEREEPGCILAVGPIESREWSSDGTLLADAVRDGVWSGRASLLSVDHVQWTFIDEIAAATRDAGRELSPRGEEWRSVPDRSFNRQPGDGEADARRIVLQRRSAVAFDGHSATDRAAFFNMLRAVLPSRSALWDVLWWTPCVHLALFVHRVNDVVPGLYLLPRRTDAIDRLRDTFRRDFLWERVSADVPLLCLARGDCRQLARRLSCDQDIAADGFFSLGMVVEFDASLSRYGHSFYRHLFWETGFVGQLLYLEAEAMAARATGIGCFYDDPVHDILGVEDHACQSLYHFTVGSPVDDARLSTEPGYAWS